MVYNKQARLDNKLYRVWEAQMHRGRNNEDDHLISVDEATTLSLKLLADGANPLVSMGGDSTLHYWAGNGPLVCLEAALKTVDRKDLNRLNERYEGERATPIENAVGRNRMDCAKALIEAGAKVGPGSTYRGDPILFRLAEHNAGADCIRAAIKINPECVDSSNNQGTTPLMFAARVGATECLKALIGGGATVDLRDKEGRTALMFAVKGRSSKESIGLLMAAGADIALLDQEGKNAAMHCGPWQEGVELLHATDAARRAAELDAKLDQACEAWSPPAASTNTIQTRQTNQDTLTQAEQQAPVSRIRQRF